MSDFIGGPASGSPDGGTGLRGGPTLPPVLLAALAAALLISVVLVAVLVSGGGSDPQPLSASDAEAVVANKNEKVVLRLSMKGGGNGRVRLAPGVTCSSSCAHEFSSGTRLRVDAEPDKASTFEAWGDACAGVDICSVLMNRDRTLSVRFEYAPPDSSADSVRENDCHDGRDNDGDGLVDAEQDPSCARGTEGRPRVAPVTSALPDETTTTQLAPPPPPPPPPPPANECGDRKDNDNDGLIDSAQDPGCVGDSTEAG